MFYRILGIELFDVLSTINLDKLSISDLPITASPHFLFATLSFIWHSVSPSQQRLGPFLTEVDGAGQIRRYHWPDILCLAQMVQVGIDDILPWMAVSRTRGVLLMAWSAQTGQWHRYCLCRRFNDTQQDHRRWRYQRRLFDYQSPYF